VNKKEYGIIVNNELDVVVHSTDCKEFISPRVSVLDRAQYDGAYKDKFVIESDLEDIEYKKSLLCLVSDNFFGGVGCIGSLVYLKCTGLVNRKTYQDVFSIEEMNDESYFGMSEENFDTLVKKTRVIKDDWI
tara:strand:+ start:91 stop:486 length:396 start_codon:yes stop_codon:yes gene_type:complete